MYTRRCWKTRTGAIIHRGDSRSERRATSSRNCGTVFPAVDDCSLVSVTMESDDLAPQAAEWMTHHRLPFLRRRTASNPISKLMDYSIP